MQNEPLMQTGDVYEVTTNMPVFFLVYCYVSRNLKD